MPRYTAPLQDMHFLLYELFDLDEITAFEAYSEASRDLVEPILNEAGKFCSEVLYPLNRSGDEEGCTYDAETKSVKTPGGFVEAYKLFCEGGWPGMACDPEFGGMGLPKSVTTLINEMMCSANLSFGIYPGLSYGAYKALKFHGSKDLQERFLPQIVSGNWSGTMCLTEPHCGTDLGLVRTKAVPKDDGSYAITGTKIFISAGEHDMSENIVHLVLAKLPDAPEGTKGISLFIVPKFIDDKRNTAFCGAIEHKMGIKASSTCVMNFDEAQGWLVGAPHKGMSYMFTMMNQARLDVGIQGLGLAETSYQGAVDYAKERLQGRSVSGAKHPDKSADPIIVHADVRRMLLTQKSLIEGMRALAMWCAIEVDHSLENPDPKRREQGDETVQLLTPIVKAFLTDMGFECANIGVQVYGGHGFIREHGMEQYVRDARIAQIYEGTNGIQSLDLIGRKLPAKMGGYLRHFFHPVASYLEKHQDNEALTPLIMPLAKAFGRLQRATGFIAQAGLKNPDDAAAGATEYLRLFALVAVGYMWCRMAEVSLGRDEAFYRSKLDTAHFFMQKVMPQTGALFASIMAGGESTMTPSEDAF